MKLSKMFLLMAALMLCGYSNASADAVLTIAPPSGSFEIGQTFTVGIYVTGPTVIHSGATYTSDVTDLDAFQFDLAFNCSVPTASPTGCQPGASVLNALSVSEGSFLPNGGANLTFFEPGIIDNTAGQILGIGDVGLSGVTGSGELVNVTFQALTAGTTDIAILANSDLQFYDSNGNPIIVANSVTTSTGKETFPTNQFLSTPVTVTPEPASVQLLFLGGVVGLIALSRPDRRLRRMRPHWLSR